ncbi:MAG: 50S ribosomal protein L25/general stress protein Ctc [Bacillus sp. (in: firmicutes)]
MSTLVAQERKNLKRSTLKEMRNNGNIPAVVYGSGISTESIAIKNADLQKVVREVGRNGLISLDLDGKSKSVMVRDYQNDPVTRDILHVDFLQVNKDTEIDAKVNVTLKGTSKGEKLGGMAKQFLHELDITAKVNNIPEDIEIDITNFDIGDTVKIADIKKSYSNCTFNHEDEEAIAMVDFVKEEEVDQSQVEVPGV